MSKLRVSVPLPKDSAAKRNSRTLPRIEDGNESALLLAGPRQTIVEGPGFVAAVLRWEIAPCRGVVPS